MPRPIGGRSVLRHYEQLLRDAERLERDGTTEAHRASAHKTMGLYKMLIKDWHNANK